MTYKRQYLIQRLYHILECNKDFYEEHTALKEHLLAKIHMLEMYDDLGIEEEFIDE